MGRSPLVSVIVPAFNAESFILRSLQSVLRQTHTQLEVIVVDDGSCDGTRQITDGVAAADPRVRVVTQPNGGVAAARNAGIAMARGEFIAPIDADDLWDPTKLERQIACINAAGPDTGMVYSWWLWIDEYDWVLDASPRWRVEGDVLEPLIEVNFVGSASVPMFRRSCLEAVGGYDPSLRAQGAEGCEDWQLSLRIAERYQLGVVPAFLVAYRRLSSGMSASCAKMEKSRTLVMDEIRRRQPSVDAGVFAQSSRQFGFYLAGVSYWSRAYRSALQWATTVPPATLLAAAPHLCRSFVRRFSSRHAPGIKFDDMRFSDYAGPESIIPFDRIYKGRWARRARGQPRGGRT